MFAFRIAVSTAAARRLKEDIEDLDIERLDVNDVNSDEALRFVANSLLQRTFRPEEQLQRKLRALFEE